MRFRRRFPRVIAIGFLYLIAGVLFVGAGPADGPTEGDGPTDWVSGSGDPGDDYANDHDGPACHGSSQNAGVHAYAPLIYGTTTMTCGAPATLQTMTVSLLKCNTWILFFCASASVHEHLDDGAQTGPGAWQLPTNDVYFVSDSLEDGRYRVSTRHTVFWPTGQDAGYSASGWLRVASN